MCSFINWLNEVIPLTKDIVFIIAAVIAGYVGISGLNTWRRQLKGNTEYNLAKNVLATIYELRDAISGARFSFSFYSSEHDLPEKQKRNLSVDEMKWHALIQSYEKRWEPVTTARAKLRISLFEAEAVWGHDLVDLINPIYVLANKLLLAIQFDLKSRNPNTANERLSTKIFEEREAILYGDLSEQDDFNKELNAVIRKIEIQLKPHIIQHHK